ncbi:DUF1963 domain-containing protein [Kocuria rosea]|uniref:DUF1963 domain-containing protein n=1 Tax=Kocuria rosea TaxID=1275 RepID=UPI000E08B416|nr:DUF1963 domain-containing protein [Kocuria rosea]STX05719.1 Domain of uncharacterised function (DUF1963) [Kocuria rosea]
MTEEPVTVDAPLHGPWGQIQSWLQAGPPGAELLLEQVAFSPGLTDQSFAAGDEELRELWGAGGWVSWLGGPAAAPLDAWPRAADGTALAHVLTLDLADLSGVVDDQGKATWPGLREGLPTDGVLEVFHDLRTFGHDATDWDTGAWVVRWVAEPARTELVPPPEEMDTPSAVCQVVLALPGFTLPPAVDTAGGPEEKLETAQTLEESLQRAWLAQRTGSTKGHPVPVSHVYGHSQHGEIQARALLAKVLPLSVPGDEHRLVLELESWTALEGWFGDAGSLEVWMRGSDLVSHRFDHAWCLIRTD